MLLFYSLHKGKKIIVKSTVAGKLLLTVFPKDSWSPESLMIIKEN